MTKGPPNSSDQSDDSTLTSIGDATLEALEVDVDVNVQSKVEDEISAGPSNSNSNSNSVNLQSIANHPSAGEIRTARELRTRTRLDHRDNAKPATKTPAPPKVTAIEGRRGAAKRLPAKEPAAPRKNSATVRKNGLRVRTTSNNDEDDDDDDDVSEREPSPTVTASAMREQITNLVEQSLRVAASFSRYLRESVQGEEAEAEADRMNGHVDVLFGKRKRTTEDAGVSVAKKRFMSKGKGEREWR